MKTNNINVTRALMPTFEEYTEEIKELWESHWITNKGIKHNQLRIELSQYLETSNITLFTNGHLALENAISVFNLKGQVITTPFTFASTTHAIVRNGLEPVFCDINSQNYTIDTDQLESLITEKTAAILPVHVYGHVCNVDAINAIAEKYHLKVIYDAAHAFGEKFKGKSIANFGDASMFSFHATKVYNTIEGGAIAYQNAEFKRVLDDTKNFGIADPEIVEYVGGNAKMSEFQAAMGICNLRHINEAISRRKNVINRYIENLNNIQGIRIVKIPENTVSNYAYFPVVFDGYKMNRDEIADLLSEQNIFARKYFYPLVNDYDCYKNRFNSNETPVAKYIADRVLTLPVYPELALDDVDKICNIIKA